MTSPPVCWDSRQRCGCGLYKRQGTGTEPPGRGFPHPSTEHLPGFDAGSLEAGIPLGWGMGTVASRRCSHWAGVNAEALPARPHARLPHTAQPKSSTWVPVPALTSEAHPCLPPVFPPIWKLEADEKAENCPMKMLSGREGASAPWDVMCPSQGSLEWGHGLHCPLTNTEDRLCSLAWGLPAAGSPRPFSEAATASMWTEPRWAPVFLC